MGGATVGAATRKRGHRCTGQQDGAHNLGLVGPQADVPGELRQSAGLEALANGNTNQDRRWPLKGCARYDKERWHTGQTAIRQAWLAPWAKSSPLEMRSGSADSIRASGQNAPHQRPNTKLQSACPSHRNRSLPPGRRPYKTGLWRGVRHRHRESRRQQLPPNVYRYRASCRLYTNHAMTPTPSARYLATKAQLRNSGNEP